MNSRTLLYGLVLFLVLAAAATGIFYQTPGAPIAFVTVRGEHATIQGSGLYYYDPASVALEGAVWDVVNLFIGVPLLALAIYLAARNSLRGRLLLGGLMFYFFYNYLMYATMVSFNRLFLVYVAIYALSLVAFFVNLTAIDVSRLPSQISAGFPRRLFIGYAVTVGAALVLLWSKMILPIMVTNQLPADIAGMNTLQTQAMDLGLVVPLAFATAALLWRRSSWGYWLASVMVGFLTMMSIVLPAWIAVPLMLQGNIDLIEAVPFLALCLVGLVLAAVFYRNVHETERAQVLTAGRPAPAAR